MDVDEIACRIGISGSYRILGMDTHETIFYFGGRNKLNSKIELGFGYQDITDKFFHKHVPGESEIEYAINYIEDELMSNDELVNVEDALYMDEKQIADLLNPFQLQNNKVSREEIEEIFTKYAFISMSRLPVYGDEQMSNEKYAKVLLLREIMHHLNFLSINIIPEQL